MLRKSNNWMNEGVPQGEELAEKKIFAAANALGKGRRWSEPIVNDEKGTRDAG